MRTCKIYFKIFWRRENKFKIIPEIIYIFLTLTAESLLRPHETTNAPRKTRDALRNITIGPRKVTKHRKVRDKNNYLKAHYVVIT